MKGINKRFFSFLAVGALASSSLIAQVAEIVSTKGYTWRGDSIIQGEFIATAPSATEIVSTYSARPGYFMPIDKQWKLKNDISSYPKLTTSNTLLNAVYNMGLDEMVNAVEPDTTLRTGKEWAGVWTRDVSYSIILSMAALQPEASKISLMKKVNSDGQIIQDTGTGGAWPISTDRMIWAVAAYELYKVTGDRQWLEYIYEVIKNSLEKDEKTVMSENGLVRGETSFIDWREQSYPRWMQPADIYRSEAFSTNVIHAAAMEVLSKIAKELGKKKIAEEWAAKAKKLTEAINHEFWMKDKGYYGMYTYGRDFMRLNPRSETLGQSLAVLYDVADPEMARELTEKSPITQWGSPIFFPGISDISNYHNNALWPFVASYWTLANAKAGNEEGVLQGIGSVVRPAALFTTNKENLNLDNGDIFTELNSSNMLWSLSGNLALTNRILFGINFEPDGIVFKPFVPKTLADTRRLENFKYRDAVLDIEVSGYGDKIKEFTLNGKKTKPFLPGNAKGKQTIRIVLDDSFAGEPIKVNMTENKKAPLTPIARWAVTPEAPYTVLEWNPIEYVTTYYIIKDGKNYGVTRANTFTTREPGEYQVIALSDDWIESFASEPMSNRTSITIPMGEGKSRHKLTEDGGPFSFDVPVPIAGEYMVTFRYANGNGPINTENKAAIRTLEVNGEKAGTIVMPQRGKNYWIPGDSNHIKVHLDSGWNKFTVVMRPEDRNMNLETNNAQLCSVTVTLIEE